MADKIFTLRILLIILITFLFLSCDAFLELDKNNDSGNFWAVNYMTGKAGEDYKVKADLFTEGKYCKIWVEKGSGVSKARAKAIADKYDNEIHGIMIDVFGYKNPSYKGETFPDIIAFADYLGDGDGKLCILLLDIKDDYRAGKNESYVAGYFWAGNFFNISGSNKSDMIYIDTYPGMRGENIDNVFITLAHELQHMMNYVTRRMISSNNILAASMDTWIDEGLSSAAEYIVGGGEHSKDRIDWYNENGDSKVNIKGLIDQGNNFFIWNNHGKENKYANLDDYATVYLFFQWLRLQKGTDVYRDIISSNYNDYHAVESAMGEDWDTLLKSWMAANYINKNTGIYGYKGDIPVITTHTAPANTSKQISLYPGEGVYSLTDARDKMPSQDIIININIKYAGLDKTGGVSDTVVFPSGRLLTYNSNTKSNGLVETGTTTGKAASVNITHEGRSVTSSYSGPYRIGAGDILSRNGKNRDFLIWDFQDK